MSKKAEELCQGIDVLKDENIALAEEVLFMAEKLKNFRKILKNEELVIEYDNGGGQKGIRENPHYTAYEHLLTAFNKSLRQLTEAVEKGRPAPKATHIMRDLSVIAGKKIG